LRRAEWFIQLGKAGPSFLDECAVYAMRGQMTVGIMAAFRSTGTQQHVETLRGTDLGLIIVRVAPFRRLLGIFHQQLWSTPQYRVGKAKRSAATLNLISRANLLAPC
jgi:hypothetical protein